MKKLLTMMVAVLFGCPLFGALTDGLVAHYKFDGNANDSSGNGNNGVVHGATLAADRFGNANSAYSFDGDDWIQVANSASLSSLTKDMTFSAWVNVRELGFFGWVQILAKGTNMRQYGFGLRMEDGDFVWVNNVRKEISVAVDGGVLPMNEWYHLTASYNGSRIIAYVNGVVVGFTDVEDEFVANMDDLYIGKDIPGDTEYFNGALDDLRIYNRALSAAEVKALYEGDCLVAWYKFDGDVRDASGNGNDLFFASGGFNGEAGVSGQAIRLTADTTLGVQGVCAVSNTFSYSCWYKTDREVRLADPQSSGTDYDSDNFVLLPCQPGKTLSGHVGVGIKVGANGLNVYEHAELYRVPVFKYENGIGQGWHNVTLTVVNDGTPTVYLDGVEVKGEMCDNGKKKGISLGEDDNQLFAIGACPDGFFNGLIDDVRIYNCALSAEEVKALFLNNRMRIKLYVDDKDYIKIQNGEIWLEHKAREVAPGLYTALPGRHDGNNYATYINDESWFPEWGTDEVSSPVDCESRHKSIAGVNMPLSRAYVYTIKPLNARNVVKISETPTERNGNMLSVEVDDGESIGGAAWYEFEIAWELLEAELCAVTFDAVGGTAGWSKGEVVKGAAVGTLPTATREGYEFLGWFTAAVGGTQVTAATVVTADVTFYAQWRKIDETPIATYGPWGEAEAVKNPDKLGPTMLTDMTLELNGAAGAVGDVVAAFRGDTGALCGLGKVMDESGTLTMACYAPTGVKLHFKVWVAASGVEEPVVVDCDAKSDLTAPTSGAFLSGHALAVSDDKDLTISLGSADWHTVSFNVLPEDPSPAAVFGSVQGKIAAVTQGIEFWMPGKTSSLKAIEIGKGYWVNTKGDDVEWTVSGKTDPKTEIALEEGWNLVGYAPETEGAVQQVLKTALAAKAVDYVTYGVEFYPGGTLKKMEPGKAYWVHAKKAYTLVYDDGAALKAVRILAGAAAGDGGSTRLGAATPTYGPWGESEAVKNPDKLGPTFLTDVAVEIDGEPAEYGDVVAVFRGDTGALCGLGKVMDGSGTLTVVCYAPKGVTLSFKVWLSESGVEEAIVVKCDNASKLVAPDVGAFYEGHEISCSTAELIETIVPGEKVTIDTGLDVGYTASGLPSGLKYDKNTGKITGSASKPTAAEGAVVKFTKKGFETEELTIVVTAIPKVMVTMEGVNSPSDTDGCKVTGAGTYLVGKKVTLKATAPKGVVFMGWAAAGDGGSTGGATYSFTMGKEDVNLVAKFKKEVMTVGCEALSSKESLPAGVLCAEDGIALDITTESGVKSVKVDKLPAGMKYDAKTGLITGAPTKAGDSKVVITVTAKSGAVAKKEIEVKVAAMPETVAGTFNGFVMVGEDNLGTFTLTTTDAGKLTAKVITAAGTVSFSGSGFAWSRDGKYGVKLETKKGEKLTLTLDSAAAWDAQQLVGNYSSANGRALDVTAQRNAFGKTWYFTADGNEATGWTFAYAATAKAAVLTVTVKADGSTAIAGSLPNGTDAKGKALTIKVSASGYANVGLMREGAMAADFAPVLTVSKVKKVLAIRTNLRFDRKNDHGSGVGEAKFVE